MGEEQGEGQTNKTRQQKTLSVGIWPIENCTSPSMIAGIWGESRGKHLSVLKYLYFFPNLFCSLNRRRKTEENTEGEWCWAVPASCFGGALQQILYQFSWVNFCVFPCDASRKQTCLWGWIAITKKQTLCRCSSTRVSVWESFSGKAASTPPL